MKLFRFVLVLLFMAAAFAACHKSGVSKSQSAGSQEAEERARQADGEELLLSIDSMEQSGRLSEDVANARRTKIYFQLQQYRMAEYYGAKALKGTNLFAEDPHAYYEACQSLVSCAMDNGDMKKGLERATKCLKQMRQDDTPEARMQEAKILSRIGMIQMRIGRMEEAYRNCEESYQLFKDMKLAGKSFNEVYMWYSSVGEMIQHFVICDVPRAIEWLPRMDEAFEAVMQATDTPPSMKDYCLSKLELTKAEIYAKSGQRAEALKHFQAYQQTDIARSGEDWISPMNYYENMGLWKNALAIYDRWDSLSLAQSIPFNKEQQQVAAMRFHAELAMGDRAKALKTAQKIVETLNSVDSISYEADAAQLSVLYETQEKELKIAEQQAALSHQRIVAIVIAISLLFLFFVVFMYFRLRAARRLANEHSKLLTAYDQLEETTAAKERIESELRIARDIQMSMVPSTFPERDGLDLYAYMMPAREVGGDLYNYLVEGDQLYFCLGDVSGKGVPASLFMAQVMRLFRTMAAQKMSPAEMCTRMNAVLCEDNEHGMFVTLFVGIVDFTTGHLTFCNAGHNPPVIGGIHDGDYMEIIPNAPLGLWPDLQYEGEEIDTIKGRPLFVYTDGLTEAENSRQEQFGNERLLHMLRDIRYESSRQVIEVLAEKVAQHRGDAEPNDDLTMLCLRVS